MSDPLSYLRDRSHEKHTVRSPCQQALPGSAPLAEERPHNPFANIFRIQDLIAAACAEGQRNKQRGNAEREKFKHGICTCAAYNKLGRCKQIRKLSADILILSVTRAVDAFIQLALPAKMNNIELLCKFRQCCPNSVVQCSRSETSTHNKYNRFCRQNRGIEVRAHACR